VHTRIQQILLSAGVVLLLVHCGSSTSTTSPSSGPTVSSLATTGGTTINTSGTTGIAIDSAFTLTFSEAMLSSTASTSNITLTCSSAQTVTIAGVTSGDTSTAFTITPSTSMPTGTACTLSVSAGVTNASATAVTAASYTFTTASASTPTASLSGTVLSTGSSGTIATSGTTDISGATTAPLTLTFSTAMSNSTVTAGTTFQCPSGTSLSPTLATADNTIYTITPTAALPQISNCVLNLAETIEDSNGNALAATSYNYTTGCSTSDDFSNSSTLSSCWTAANASGATIAIAGDVLNMSTSTTSGFSFVQENKTFANDNVTVTVSIPTFSGINSSNDICGLWIQDESSQQTGIMALVEPDGGNIVINAAYVDGSSDNLSASLGAGSDSSVLAGTLFLKIAQSGTSLTVSYRVGSSGAFTDIVTKTVNYGSSKKIGLLLKSDGTGTTNCQYANFTVTGGTATGQY